MKSQSATPYDLELEAGVCPKLKITEETKRSVLALLIESPLTADAFVCDFDLDDGTRVSIVLEGQEHFYYTLHPSEIEGKPWEVRESPGALFHGAETCRFGTLDEAIGYIGGWLGRVEAQIKGRGQSDPRASKPADDTKR